MEYIEKINNINEKIVGEGMIDYIDEETISVFNRTKKILNEQQQKKFLVLTEVIEEKNSKQSDKLLSEISANILVGCYEERVNSLSNDSLNTLSLFFTYIGVDSYDEYLRIFSNEELLNTINEKSITINDKLDSFTLIEDVYYGFGYDETDISKYHNDINDFMKNISSEEIGEKAKEITARMNKEKEAEK